MSKAFLAAIVSISLSEDILTIVYDIGMAA